MMYTINENRWAAQACEVNELVETKYGGNTTLAILAKEYSAATSAEYEAWGVYTKEMCQNRGAAEINQITRQSIHIVLQMMMIHLLVDHIIRVWRGPDVAPLHD